MNSRSQYASHPDDFVVVAGTGCPIEIWARRRRLAVLSSDATEADAIVMAAAPALRRALHAVVDVLVRCDAEQRPNDLPQCTDEEWDAALAQGRAALGKVTPC